MRILLFTFLFLTCLPAFAQDSTSVTDLLAGTAWQEIKGSGKGYVLILSDEGNFDEDAGPDYQRPYRHLLGRWTTDSTEHHLELAVDGLMGKGLVPNRYLRGRDYFLNYRIVDVSAGDLILADVLTGKRRIFIAVDYEDREDQSEKRKPQAPKPPAVFTLPDFNGGQ